MTFLVAGIALFVGVHSTRLVAPQWRERFLAEHGTAKWKLIHAVLSIGGLALMIYGFGLSRVDPVLLWNPPPEMRYVALPLTLIAFILFAASGAPPNLIKYKLGHPMYAGVKVWAFAHLLANGRLGDVLLFGTFLIWAVAGFAISRRRDRLAGISYPAGNIVSTFLVMLGGCVIWFFFTFWLHGMLIGVQPF